MSVNFRPPTCGDRMQTYVSLRMAPGTCANCNQVAYERRRALHDAGWLHADPLHTYLAEWGVPIRWERISMLERSPWAPRWALRIALAVDQVELRAAMLCIGVTEGATAAEDMLAVHLSANERTENLSLRLAYHNHRNIGRDVRSIRPGAPAWDLSVVRDALSAESPRLDRPWCLAR